MVRRAPSVVGRDDEIALIQSAFDDVARGKGHVVFLTGEPGVGKSRLASLATDMAAAARMGIMRGRGSAVSRMVPFRCLSEALLSLQRLGTSIDVEQLGPYRPALARLNPDWGAPAEDTSGGSLMVLAEGMLRLTELVGRAGGCAVIVDDLQFADPDTLAVLEYMIDNIEFQPTLMLCTVRDEPSPALDLVTAVSHRAAATVSTLRRLTPDQVHDLASECLGGVPLPSAVVDLVWAGSAGLPLLVEELLDEIVSQGRLVHGDGGWHLRDSPAATVPSVLVRSVVGRFARLSAQAREFLSVAAVIGQRFPLAVVQKVTDVDYRTLLRYLHSDLVAYFVSPDDHTPDWYVFSHTLVAGAVLDLVPEEDRADLAKRAANAVEELYPGVHGDWCHLCATLRETAGQLTAAGTLYADAGRRALAQGAAQSAVTLLDRSLELLVHDPALRCDALEAQLLALTEAGQVGRALAMGATFDEVSSGLDPKHRARLHTQVAWSANLAGRTEDGLAQLRIARALLGQDADPEDIAPIDVVAAHLELDLGEPSSAQRAERMALHAAETAERIPLPVVACQAWQLLGALTRQHDPARATAYLERSRAFAITHGLPIWEIHALVRLGLDDALRTGDLSRLEQARTLASRIGAVIARYQSEVNIGLQLVLRGEFTTAKALVDEVTAAAARLGLLEIHQFMLVLRAVLAGHRGDRAGLVAARHDLAVLCGSPTQHAPRLDGLASALCSLLDEDRDQARADLAAASRAEQATPMTFQLTGRHGLGPLLAALDGTVAEPDIAADLRWDRHFALLAAAVLAGRAGDGTTASARVVEAQDAGALYPMARNLGLRLVSEAAVRDGWGDPETWLRTAEQYFHTTGVPTVAGACRGLLRHMGFRVAQRRSGAQDVPDHLRLAGVTVREYEVLRMLGARLTNSEIADRLFVSSRTVEKHVSSLIAKTGLVNRRALRHLAGTEPWVTRTGSA